MRTAVEEGEELAFDIEDHDLAPPYGDDLVRPGGDIGGAGLACCPISKPVQMIARADHNLHTGYADLPVVLVDHGSEAID